MAKYAFNLFSTIFVVSMFLNLNHSKDIKCNLVWVSISSEDSIPEHAIPMVTTEPVHFIARFQTGEINNGTWVGGRYFNNLALAVVNGRVEESNVFDILTNPFGCLIKWEQNVDNLVIPISDGADTFVGRTYSGESLLSGFVDASSKTLQYVNELKEPIASKSNIQIAKAYSKGLECIILGFNMDIQNSQLRTEFLGMDTINNPSPATVKQSVTHRKKLKQDLHASPSSARFGTIFSNTKLSIQLNFGGQGGPVFELSSTNGSFASGTEEKEIVTTREVIVPEHTSVHFCSILQVAEGFQTSYTARAEATGAGLSPNEVKSLLEEEGENDWIIEEMKVVKEVSGTLRGTVALTSQFMVSPTNIKNGGCLEILKLINEIKNLRNGNKEVLQEKQQRLFSILHG